MADVPHQAKKSRKGRKIGRNVNKCKRYRAKIGKPRGPGVAGAKSGKNYAPVATPRKAA